MEHKGGKNEGKEGGLVVRFSSLQWSEMRDGYEKEGGNGIFFLGEA